MFYYFAVLVLSVAIAAGMKPKEGKKIHIFDVLNMTILLIIILCLCRENKYISINITSSRNLYCN